LALFLGILSVYTNRKREKKRFRGSNRGFAKLSGNYHRRLNGGVRIRGKPARVFQPVVNNGENTNWRKGILLTTPPPDITG
jgi:hypothetical protein